MPATTTRIRRLSVYDDSYCAGVLGTVIAKPQGVDAVSSRTGSVNPSYKQKIRDNLEATTALSAYAQTSRFLQRPGRLTCKALPAYGGVITYDTAMGMYQGNGYNLAMPLSTLTSISQSMKDSAKADCIAAATRKIKAIQSPFDTQVFAAELKDVKMLLTGPLSSSIKLLTGTMSSLQAVKKNGGVRSLDRLTTKDIANLHLELQFGIIPLISDMKRIVEVLSRKSEDRLVESIHAYGRADKTVIDQFYAKNSRYNGCQFDFRQTAVASAEYFIRSGLAAAYQERAHGITALSDDLIDLLSVPVTLWEVTPYSFLIDYFVNIGDIIDSSTRADSYVSWTSQTSVETYEERSMSTYVGFSANVYESVQLVGSPVKEVTSKVRRVTRSGGSIGIPPLVVTLPGSATRYANIAALLYSKIPNVSLPRIKKPRITLGNQPYTE